MQEGITAMKKLILLFTAIWTALLLASPVHAADYQAKLKLFAGGRHHRRQL